MGIYTSGGHFDYAQYRIRDIWASIEEYVDGKELDECEVDDYIKSHFYLFNEDDEAERNYIRKHNHTLPNCYEFSKATMREFKKAIECLKKAEIYAQRIDWLLSGDDGEDNFHERLKEDMEELKNNKKK